MRRSQDVVACPRKWYPKGMTFLVDERSDRPADDPIFALNAEAKRRAASGESIINATIGALLHEDGRLAVLETVVDALRQVPPAVGAGYAPISGTPEFLQAVIEDVVGKELAASTIAVATPGGTGALRTAISNFLSPGQAVLTTNYFWEPYQTICAENERKLSTFRMFGEQGGFDTSAMRDAVASMGEKQGRVLLLLNSPCHNPTGYSLDDQEWKHVASVLSQASKRTPVTVLVDMAYARYASESMQPAVEAMASLPDGCLVLFAWSASKAFTQYGARVGALLALHRSADNLRRVRNAFSFSCRGVWSNCNAAGLAAVGRLLSDPTLKSSVESERSQLKALLDARVASFNEHASPAGLRYPRYRGGFFTTVFCTDAQASAARLRQRGIYVVPIGRDALRVALCAVPQAKIAELVAGLRDCTL